MDGEPCRLSGGQMESLEIPQATDVVAKVESTDGSVLESQSLTRLDQQTEKSDEADTNDPVSSSVLVTYQQSNPVKIYHERQSKQLCALHALNNLFQSPKAFKKQELDAICKELSPESWVFNPHRSALGFGCYDVNVIIAALAKKDFDVVWFDKRKELSSLDLDKIFGLILNVPNTPTIPFNYLPLNAQVWSSQKHWIAIKKIGAHYHNLDSKLFSPVCIGDKTALLEYLFNKSSVEQVEILIVTARSKMFLAIDFESNSIEMEAHPKMRIEILFDHCENEISVSLKNYLQVHYGVALEDYEKTPEQCEVVDSDNLEIMNKINLSRYQVC